ncbi:MAG: glycosyltransferase family 4 protein [Pirellulaceae bacterium]
MPTPRPTIWAVSRLYVPNFSGAAIQAQRLLSGLARQGWQIHVLTSADLEASGLQNQTTELDGVHIHYIPIVRRREWRWLRCSSFLQNRLRYLNQLFSDMSMNRRMGRYLQQHAAVGDVVQLYSVDEFSLLLIRAARKRGLKSIIQMSLVGADDPSSFRRTKWSVLTRLKLQAFAAADWIVGLSSALTTSCQNAGFNERKIMRIPNAVDGEVFHPVTDKQSLRRELNLLPSHRYLIFVGSALHRKGIEVVVRTFIQLASSFPDLQLLIAGIHDFSDTARHPAERRHLVDTLRKEMATAGLQDRVHWLGNVNNVSQYLQASDLFFFPTRREGLPNAMAEAMSCGLPVVASLLPGITTDLVPHSDVGVLVKGHEVTDYVHAITLLLRSPERLERMGTAAAERIRSEYAVDVIVQQYADLYRQISEKPGK